MLKDLQVIKKSNKDKLETDKFLSLICKTVKFKIYRSDITF